MDIKELLDTAKLPEKEVRICLRADLTADFEAAEADLAEAQRAARAANSLNAGEDVHAAAQRVEEIRAQMAAASATFRLRAVGRRQWTQLYADHLPREGDNRDAAAGFNRETFFEALTRACIADPQISDAEWELLADVLSAAQWDALVDAAWEVNRAGVDVPFSSAASRALSTTAPASERPEGSESPSSDSTDGNPQPSTPTTTAEGSPRPARKRNGTKSNKH
jgi:hypothetical protein